VLPSTYAKAPAGYPNPFGGKIQAKVNFDSTLSESRYYVVSSLFDQVITFRLKELQAATKAIHEADKRLGAKAAGNAQLAEAKKLAWTPPVSASRPRTRSCSPQGEEGRRCRAGEDADRGGVEQQGQGQLRPRRRARQRREMILVALALAIAAFRGLPPRRSGPSSTRRSRPAREASHSRTSRRSSRSRSCASPSGTACTSRECRWSSRR
jgi:hypothetical protein